MSLRETVGFHFRTYGLKSSRRKRYAISFTVGVRLGLNAISFGTVTGFKTVISNSYYGVLYADIFDSRRFLQSCALFPDHLVVSSVTNPPHSPHSMDHLHCVEYTSLLRDLDIEVDSLITLFLLFASITFKFPSNSPVTSESMNDTNGAIVMMTLLSLLTWFTTATSRFVGPSDVRYLIVDGVERPSTLQPADDVGLRTNKGE
ncbi:Amino acid/polyamine transporter I [Penicillium robsamsonii]|uniref:Amino acid/polyamine transporter I n=1 Tax=Penicillium robsamsonii TaxID=1792511 RepID=UPI002546C865|nr:Amino acid/polyamine transporter I [Penicillium robsamsonii]KAJ5816200.1 Amino acid/polyamine transporter I [Penicillium robsamsonii]